MTLLQVRVYFIHHVYGHGLIGSYDVDGDFETHHYDYRGSTTGMTDELGSVLGTVSYDEYGVITHQDETVTTRFLYNGLYGVQTDQNGLYYMRARFYNPDLKRFMNRDVVMGSITEPQTLNRYAFVNGNPISYHDPFGLARETLMNSIASMMPMIHTILDFAGMVPVLGMVPDAINASLYLSKGDFTNAAWSSMGIIPFLGEAATGAKYANRAIDGISFASKHADKIVDGAKLAGKYGDDVAKLGTKGYNKVKGVDGVSNDVYKKLRRKTPNAKIRKMVNPDGPKIDPVYGYNVDKFEADHIVPMKDIINMPGFNKLSTEKQVKVLNLEDNFIGLGKSTNASKGAHNWSDWKGHSKLGDVPNDVRSDMLKLEDKARQTLQSTIVKYLK